MNKWKNILDKLLVISHYLTLGLTWIIEHFFPKGKERQQERKVERVIKKNIKLDRKRANFERMQEVK